MRQLKQRIALRVYIRPFTRSESFDYIAHRLAKTAENGAEIFSRGALNLIVDSAGGIPRVIKFLCDNCLITAFGRQQKQVSSAIAMEVLADFDMGRPETGGLRRYAAAAACILSSLQPAGTWCTRGPYPEHLRQPRFDSRLLPA